MAISDINDAKVKEDFGSFSGDMEDGTGGTFQRVFHVEHEDLAYAQAPLDATEHVDIPNIGHKIVANGFSFYLIGYGFDRGEGSHERVMVTCNYKSFGTQSSDSPDYDSADNQVAEERRRKRTYGTPFNEKLELQGDREEVYSGLDDGGDPIPLLDAVSVLDSKAIWSFDVMINPKVELYSKIGGINLNDYPSGTYDSRPFRFDSKNLMYLGATGEEANVPVVDTPSGIPQHWVWKMTLSFAFNSRNWDIEYQYPTREVSFDLPADGLLYFYDYTGEHTPAGEGAGYADSGESVIHLSSAEMPLLVPDGAGGYKAPFSARIEEREFVEFNTVFDFDWSPIGT